MRPLIETWPHYNPHGITAIRAAQFDAILQNDLALGHLSISAH